MIFASEEYASASRTAEGSGDDGFTGVDILAAMASFTGLRTFTSTGWRGRGTSMDVAGSGMGWKVFEVVKISTGAVAGG